MSLTAQEPLRDRIGRAIYDVEEERWAKDRPDWYSLPEERREPWRKDADRVVAVICDDLRDMYFEARAAVVTERQREPSSSEALTASTNYAKAINDVIDVIRGRRLAPVTPIIGDLDPAFHALVDGEISMGRMREIVSLWLSGQPYALPDDEFVLAPTNAGQWRMKMQIGPYTVLEHTETVKPERFVVFWQRDGKTERAEHLGKRGGFRTLEAAVEAATNLVRFGDANA